ncbi:HlyD family efflux transporter periplasmic adaptor subunit [Vibrio parahaemolyticus]|uniref:HlyD family efflux transporter periplasmic adaptor subunit n=1 Tax=Vibrio parahaemolyticus TaxID=670 RepID=UPI0012FA8142|nr:HlyD family efflux transporter periplasmic adaptor subunit [Vibrio parahaemolyticus]MUT56047.1 HlyD family efflux transporter periplasmic adaptor subunit [Vibrio parahaemolyticus]
MTNKNKLLLLLSISFVLVLMTSLKFEVVTPGNGVIIGGAGDIDIITPDSGFINALNVKVGEHVEKGDVLFSYNNLDVYYRNDSLVNMSDFLLRKRDFISSDITLMREVLNNSRTILNGHESYVSIEDKYPGSNADRYIKEFESILRKTLDLKTTESMIQSEITELESQIELIDRKIKLLNRGNSPAIDIIESQKERAQIAASKIKLEAELISSNVNLKNEIDLFQISILEKISNLNEELNKINKEILEVNDSLALVKGRKNANIITSPVNGVVLNIDKQFTIGTYIDSSQKVLTIKQNQSASLIRAKIESQYRPFIRVDAETRIVINSPGYKKTLHGKIKSISVDSFLDDNNPGSTSRFYEVEVLAEEKNTLDNAMIGVQANIYVVSNNTTIFDFISATIIESIYFGVW